MVDKDKTGFLLSQLDGYLKDLEGMKQLSLDEYLGDSKNIYSLRYLFQVSIETCISLATHIISANKLGLPKEYADAFRILHQNKIIDQETEDRLIQMTRFRNRLVHVYWDVDDQIIFQYLQEHLADFDQFKKAVREYLG